MSIVKLNNRGVRSVTAFGSLTSGSFTHILTSTISSATSNVQFIHGTNGVDFTAYKEYIFYLVDMHHSSDNEPDITFNLVLMVVQITMSQKHLLLLGRIMGKMVVGALGYYAPTDAAQSTANIPLSFNADGDNDSTMVAYLHLFNPSSTTFVKHFIGQVNEVHDLPRSNANYFAGYLILQVL